MSGHAKRKRSPCCRLYCVGARWELQTDDEATRVIWYPWPGALTDPAYRAAMDYAVADMDNAIRRLGLGEPRPAAVLLRHSAPADAAAFSRQYGVAPARSPTCWASPSRPRSSRRSSAGPG